VIVRATDFKFDVGSPAFQTSGPLISAIVRARFLDRCDLRATAFGDLVRHSAERVIHGAGGLPMIGYVVSDGRLLSLQAAEWLMLLAGGALAGSLILLF